MIAEVIREQTEEQKSQSYHQHASLRNLTVNILPLVIISAFHLRTFCKINHSCWSSSLEDGAFLPVASFPKKTSYPRSSTKTPGRHRTERLVYLWPRQWALLQVRCGPTNSGAERLQRSLRATEAQAETLPGGWIQGPSNGLRQCVSVFFSSKSFDERRVFMKAWWMLKSSLLLVVLVEALVHSW